MSAHFRPTFINNSSGCTVGTTTRTVAGPAVLGHITDNVIYKRMPPGVLKEPRKIVPRDEKGRLKKKLFQGLTPDIGHPKLREQLVGTTMIAKYRYYVSRSLTKGCAGQATNGWRVPAADAVAVEFFLQQTHTAEFQIGVEDPSDRGCLRFVHHQLSLVHVVAERHQPAHPEALALGGRDLVANALAGDLRKPRWVNSMSLYTLSARRSPSTDVFDLQRSFCFRKLKVPVSLQTQDAAAGTGPRYWQAWSSDCTA